MWIFNKVPDALNHLLNFDQDFCIQSINQADDFTPYLMYG